MKKKKQLVWFIAVITGLVITGFQLFWLNQTFAVSRTNFVKTAANDLQKSISRYQLQQNEGLLKQSPADSNVSFFVNDSARQPVRLNKWKRYKTGLSPNNMQTMRILLSGMLSQVINDPIAIKSIRALYQKELNHDGIPLGFDFTVLPNQSKLKAGSITATLGLSTNSPLLVADFQNTASYLMRLNLPNVAVSVALLLLTSGCLWYMASVIRQQSRLQQLQSAFISNMAHEFRTPVAILQSTHEALNQFGKLDDREKALRYLTANQVVLAKMEKDIDRILRIAPLDHGQTTMKPEEVNLYELLEAVLGRYGIQSEAELQLNYLMENKLVTTDRFMLDSIISNLADNALKYGGDPPIVTFTAREMVNGWQLEIKDNGHGIAPEYLPYIFDRFYRVPQGDVHDTRGYGLGLSFARELTKRLHGKLHAASIPGEGSIFTLQFPSRWKK